MACHTTFCIIEPLPLKHLINSTIIKAGQSNRNIIRYKITPKEVYNSLYLRGFKVHLHHSILLVKIEPRHLFEHRPDNIRLPEKFPDPPLLQFAPCYGKIGGIVVAMISYLMTVQTLDIFLKFFKITGQDV